MTAKEAIQAILQGIVPPEGDYGETWTSVINHLRRKLKGDGLEAATRLYDILRRSNRSLADLMDTPDEATKVISPCPPLLEDAAINPTLGVGACGWLDKAYIPWSAKWAPEAPDEMHELAGLFILSTIAARRVHISFGRKGQYTNLMLALVARTTMHTKTTAALNAKDVIRALGLGYLLGPDQLSPERMLSDMAGKIPDDYGTMLPEEQGHVKQSLIFAGQRGWYIEEFGHLLRGMMKENSPQAGFHGLMRIIDDCPDEYETRTFIRGVDRARHLYLALLATMTPADLRKAAKHGADMWADGFWARFGFATPMVMREGEFPENELPEIPDAILTPLKEWHEKLGIPEVDIEPLLDDAGKPLGRYRINRRDVPPQECQMASEVRTALYRYRRALRRMVASKEEEDTDGNYGRFSTLALRIAMLFASLENEGKIEIRHWARAQTITERMRASLHRLLDSANQAPPSHAFQVEKKLLEAIDTLLSKGEKTTARNIGRAVHISTGEAKLTLEPLVASGFLVQATDGKAMVYLFAASSLDAGKEVSHVSPVAVSHG